MTKRPAPPSGEGRFAYDGLDRVIHEKARLGILASLAAHPDGLTFNDLKELCGLTDGNLNQHLVVLDGAELVAGNKTPGRGRAQTVYALTAGGRKRFMEYVNVLESVVADAAQVRASEKSAKRKPSAGWSPA